MITFENFMSATSAIFKPLTAKEIEFVTNNKPNYVSASGSAYWYKGQNVYRVSNHWGADVASCNWGYEGCGTVGMFGSQKETLVGKCALKDFMPNGEVKSLEIGDKIDLIAYDENKQYRRFKGFVSKIENLTKEIKIGKYAEEISQTWYKVGSHKFMLINICGVK